MKTAVLQVVRQGKAKPTDIVFAGEPMSPENVSDFRFHDLRHTAGS